MLDGEALGANWTDGCALLIGGAGQLLWREMPEHWFERENPLDEYSAELTRECVAGHFPDIRQTTLFPQLDSDGETPVLQRLGRLAGWHHDSPLGNGISVEYGLWFAYRAVIYLHARAIVQSAARTRSPCLDCIDQPCVSACPAHALSSTRPPDMQRCTEFRLSFDSICQSGCVARVACPVAREWRYGDEQIAYHYEHSLRSMKQWLSSNQ